MANDSDRTQNIPVKLKNGRIIRVEVMQTGREDVAIGAASEFEEVTDALEGIVQAIAQSTKNPAFLHSISSSGLSRVS